VLKQPRSRGPAKEHQADTEVLGKERSRLEPVAAIGHPPAADPNGNGSQQRPQDGQAEVRNQSEHDKGSPEDLALHFIILARPTALWPLGIEQIS